MTLDYVNTLWKALIEEFNFPPLIAVIDEIVSGSLIVSWLVPPQVSNVIAVSYFKALAFYQKHNIVPVELDDCTLYDVKWIVSYVLSHCMGVSKGLYRSYHRAGDILIVTR